MRALLTCLLIGCAGPAQAMNWEGHDDWMADAGPALLYKDAVPAARTVQRPSTVCPTDGSKEVRNPYEQIPLERPDCRAREEERAIAR